MVTWRFQYAIHRFSSVLGYTAGAQNRCKWSGSMAYFPTIQLVERSHAVLSACSACLFASHGIRPSVQTVTNRIIDRLLESIAGWCAGCFRLGNDILYFVIGVEIEQGYGSFSIHLRSGHRGRRPSIVFVTYPWRDIVSMSAVVQAVTVDGAPPLYLSHILGGISSRCPPSFKRSPRTVPLHRVCHISLEGNRLDVRRRSSGHRGRRPSIVFATCPVEGYRLDVRASALSTLTAFD